MHFEMSIRYTIISDIASIAYGMYYTINSYTTSNRDI